MRSYMPRCFGRPAKYGNAFLRLAVAAVNGEQQSRGNFLVSKCRVGTAVYFAHRERKGLRIVICVYIIREH